MLVKKLKWRNLKIGFKFGTALLVTISLFVISMFIISVLNAKTSNDMDILYRKDSESKAVNEFIQLVLEQEIIISDFIMFPGEKVINDYRDKNNLLLLKLDEISDILDLYGLEKDFTILKGNIEEVSRIFMDTIKPAVERNQKALYMVPKTELMDKRAEIVSILEKVQLTINDVKLEAKKGAQEDMAGVNATLLMCLILSTILSALTMYLISAPISRSLRNVIRKAEQITEGNLETAEIEYKGNDEIGQVARSFNSMNVFLKEIISSISGIATITSQKSEELNEKTGIVKGASSQISDTMSTLAADNQEQVSFISGISNKLEAFERLIYDVNTLDEELNGKSGGLLEVSQKGRQLMEHSVKSMENIDAIFRDSIGKLQMLNGKSKEISKLVEVIRMIANQTNLLSLNAAIEAARAGESGKGFAVVAEEIRALSEQVDSSVKVIIKIVQGVEGDSKLLTESLNAGYAQVEKDTGQIKTTGETFEKIHLDVTEMADKINNISRYMDEMVSGVQFISEQMKKVTAFSENTAAATEETTATLEEQHASIEFISGSVQELADLIADMKQLVSKFVN